MFDLITGSSILYLKFNRGTSFFSGRRQLPIHCRSVMHNEKPFSNPLPDSRQRDNSARRTVCARHSGFRLIREQPIGK
jgi:hypothetical protein